ncbi:zinc finger protein 333-like [Carassius auratus]|uniref:Zinc finger protein 333-like n=1 Tax=Carassius auratus TaxID=7957 RepID=A0A6P6QIW7_CARAU|nr:zinc finger protein 333-like [Carassius auratus]
MSYCSFQAQLVSFMELVAKAAEAEISRRVDESCAVIRLELTRSRRDIDALKRKCVLLDGELRRVRGRGRRRVWFRTQRDSDVSAIRDQEQNPDQNPDQSVCSPDEGTGVLVIKQERQEQESSSAAAANRPFDPEQQNIQQIQAQENHKPLLGGASEIPNTHCTHSQTSTERRSAPGLQVKAEEDDEEPRGHLRFAQLWTNTEPSRNMCLDPVETQMELYEPERIGADDGETGAGVDSGPALARRLRTHWRSSADVEKRFSCSYCEKSFSRFGQLKEHLRSHTGEKPFACAQCGRSFTKHCNLIRHAVVHSGEKPYQCGQCGKRFTQRSSLKSHQRTHSSARGHS